MKIKRIKLNGIAAFPRTTCKTKHMDRKYLNKIRRKTLQEAARTLIEADDAKSDAT